MIVTAKLFGTLHRFASPGSPGLWRGNLPSGATVQDVVHAIGADEREVSAAALNGVMTPLDTTVPPEADLLLVTLMGGG
ncbi:MAG: MoaD/ThiS family protein [Spirochaetia bacterium]